MKHTAILLALTFLFSHAHADTESEVREAIIDAHNRTIETMRTEPSAYSNLGALEFWSNGGLLERVPPGGGEPSEYVIFTVVPKHVEVLGKVCFSR